MRVSDGSVVWDDFGGMPVASLPLSSGCPDIERYTGIGCPCLHLRLYSTVMRAHELNEPQMITLFPLSLSGAAQRWFASLESSRRPGQRSPFSSFISRWRGKIAEIVDRPSERDQIQMVLRSLQPRIARHVVGVPFTDFGSLVMALTETDRGLVLSVHPVRGLSDAISPIPQFSEPHSSYASHQYRPRAPRPACDQTHMPQTLVLPSYAAQGIERPAVSYTATGQPCYAAQSSRRPAAPYPRPRAQQTSAPFALRT
ncbi:hypothetical protein CK203_045628 [Vitis vinifera]|uniref:Retrotransposon gag domain-containing protein n=1 Tax=Vitis vinifera TaxID=29760 RepID=A0A438HQ15_VITVI|nr:hypothetical protein CK203_045628 [Vitis vinifera]